VTYLDETYPKLKDKIISHKILYNINEILREAVRHHWEFSYNISTQIVLEH
jgi:hypothetical protein